ncbi:MAG: Rha family transcriptional regulator [Oscillospiraceae bacterium]|jgi:Rha family phage regulatory protein|nr:Rha family transcriptional regulator [Oscillospiraceae bacterium]
MTDLTIIKQNGGAYIDSREVADVIGKPHNDLMKSIRKYSGYLTAGAFSLSEYFVSNSYYDSTGRELPCYLLTKMGCELVANKLTGEKGVLFTAAYVARFNEIEAIERAEQNALRAPRLGEFNATARIVVRALKNASAPPERILEFLKNVYEPLGITVLIDTIGDVSPRMYTAYQIAQLLGIFSLSGKPHSQAVSCILNDYICIDECRKSVVTVNYGDHIGVSVRYDGSAIDAVCEWLANMGYPGNVDADGRTYRIAYAV